MALVPVQDARLNHLARVVDAIARSSHDASDALWAAVTAASAQLTAQLPAAVQAELAKPSVWARDLETEPLLQDSADRFTLHPIAHHDIHELYQRLRDKFWFVSEVDLSQDRSDMAKLTPAERQWLLNTLAFFASSDGVVVENLVSRVMNEIKMPEARHFFGMQVGNETVHSEMYSELITNLVTDAAERLRLFSAMSRSPAIAAKAEWALQFTRNKDSVSLGELLIVYACLEGIMFSASFACIFKFRERNLFPGLSQANLMISGDEYKHMQNGLRLYDKYVVNRLPVARIHTLVREAVALEEMFVLESLPEPVMGMSADLMCTYVQFIGNFLVRHIDGVPDVFARVPTNPLPYMEQQGQQVMTGFFERRVAEYQKQGRQASAGEALVDFSITDF